MQNQNNRYDEHLALIQGENINVGTSDDGKDFLILISWLSALIIVVILFFNSIAGIVIDSLSLETQTKIEQIFSSTTPVKSISDKKYNIQLRKLNYIKSRIIKLDKRLKNKDIPVSIIKNKEINAMLYPNGSIAVTTGLLDLNPTEAELAFVLAHEIGHYSNKDHLKSISKKILIVSLATMLGQDIYVQKIINGINEIEFLAHSRNQEKEADLYANNVIIKIYGNNNAAISFMKKLDNNENRIEFLTYFSTHPSTEERIKLLESHNQ